MNSEMDDALDYGAFGFPDNGKGLEHPGMEAHRASFDQECVRICRHAAASCGQGEAYDYVKRAATALPPTPSRIAASATHGNLPNVSWIEP